MSYGWKIQPVANDETVGGSSVFTVKDQLCGQQQWPTKY